MPITERLLKPIVAGVVSHARWVLTGFLICTAALGWQARKFQVDASAETLLMRNNEHYIQSRVVNERFSPQEFLLIAYEPHRAPVLSKETFVDLATLSEEIRKLPRVESVRSLINVPLFTDADDAMDAGTNTAEQTIEHGNFTIDKLKEIFSDHPIYKDLLINEAQTATAIQVLFKHNPEIDELDHQILELEKKALGGKPDRAQRADLKKLKKTAEPLEQELTKIRTQEIETIRKLIAGYEDHASLYLGGVHVLAYQLITIIKSDLLLFGSAILVMICMVLFFLFRKVRWVVLPFLCCGVCVICTMGLFGMLGLKTTVISSSFIAMQLIMTLALVVHLVVQYREYSAEHPQWDQVELVGETLLRKSGPCIYCGVTTCIGFASLITSRIQPVISFGWMMIIAMFITVLATLLVFPAILSMLPRDRVAETHNVAHRFVNFCKDIALQHGTAVLVVTGIIMAGGIAGIFFLDAENSFINYFRHRTRVHQELAFIDKQFGGSTPLDLVYTMSPEERTDKNLVLTAQTVQLMQRIEDALKKHEATGKVLSLVNFAQLARQINENKPLTEYELTALYWTMEKALRADLLGSFFAPDFGQVRFGIRIQDTTEGLDRAQYLEDLRSDLTKLGIPKERFQLTNLFVLYQDILQQLFRSQIQTMGTVTITLTLAFLIIFRSVKVALITLIPNLLPSIVVLGVMGWAGLPLDIMTITIASIAIGIAVDDTIYYVHRYLEELEHHDEKKAVERTHFSSGFAALYTSAIIIIGFSSLAFSDFVPSVFFGLLTGLTMIVALPADLLLLPVLLSKFVKPKKK